MVGDLLDANYWRYRGFRFSRDQRAEIERFFAYWHGIYGRPGIDCFRSQDALSGVHEGLLALFETQKSVHKQRAAVSVLRAGYAIAITEHTLNYRAGIDPNLHAVFELMKQERDGSLPTGLAHAMLQGTWLGEVVRKMVLDDPSIAASLPGFPYREAVLVQLQDTLVKKLNVRARGFLSDGIADAAMRWGHAVGVAEESLPLTTPPGVTGH
jgi:hypothetical protein